MAKLNDSPASPPCRSYHFFKIFLPNLSSTHLKIPPAFQQYVEGQAPARFYLKGPSEYVWGADLVKKSDGLFLTDGWENFAFDHDLVAGDFLLFKYNGSLTFSVMIFDNSACEKEGAFFARPTCDEKVSFSLDERLKEEEKEEAFVAMNQSLKRKRTLLDTKNDCREVVMATMWPRRRQPAALISGRIERSRDTTYPFNKIMECSRDANLMLSDKRTGDGSQKKQQHRGFVSQRRPVTQEERDDALAKARSFKSDKPFMMMIMKGSYVYHGFYLTLPGPFPFKHLPGCNGEVFLHDPNKQKWSVRYIFSRRPALSGGWGKFAVGNNLEIDDVCVFELIERRNLKVHIFRVLEDVKPLLRVGQVKKLGVKDTN
ncbi:B3 domain-containing protein Os11g0197600-like isoform X2 [Phalaenopsis equestris]|uniref:B3 domain-containing protein Os11g0197600-like isoform X2 n=1 Tax=Phalaenopsis equestris TaxID=78828 RepID=UPI0009E3376C|nr:B3 domain-containing protein Os11g0197600-like isoform X2 [Phalaenopsis equestris]